MQLAEMLGAQPAGRRRWRAKCPSHEDRRPSLSIAQGERGVLLRCWAGCRTEQVMAAIPLPMAALFDDAQLSPNTRAEAMRLRRERDAATRAAHHAECERNRELLGLERLRDALGAKLARSPDDAELGKLFHRACDRLHEAETITTDTRLAENEPPERIA